MKLILLLFLLNTHQSFCKKYHNHTLYRGIPINEEHLDYYKNLTVMYDVNFWSRPGLLNKPIEFTVGPDDIEDFLVDAARLGLYVTTIMEDVQSAFDNQTVKTYIRRLTDSFDWMNYFRVGDLYNWIADLAKRNPDKMKLTSLGTTVEGRDILAVSVNMRGNEDKMLSNSKSSVIIEGGIHAREWISISFVTYFLNEIVHASESKNKELQRIASIYDWHFVPVLNPDGYEYSHTKDRLWRKNRNGGSNSIDINRNFDYDFGHAGVSEIESSDIYCGSKAFSEKESKAMSDFVRSKSSTLQYYFGFHSFGQYIIIPDNSNSSLNNFDEIKSLANYAAKRVLSKYGTKYSVGSALDTVGYTTSGVSGDWVKNTFNTRVVATIELPDEGQHGFALPPNRILPICRETLDLMLAFLGSQEGNRRGKLTKPVSSDVQMRTLNHVMIVFYVILSITVLFDYFRSFIYE